MTIYTKAQVLCAVAGAAFCADLFLFADAATGFVRVGGVALRYILLAAVVAAVAVLMHRLPKPGQEHALPNPKSMGQGSIVAAIGFFAGAAAAFATAGAWRAFVRGEIPLAWLLESISVPRIGLGVLYLVSAVWLILLANKLQTAQRPSDGSVWGGVAAAAAMILCCLLRYIEHPASNKHLTLIVGLLAAIVALLFLAGGLRAVYLQDVTQKNRFLTQAVLVFLFGVCLLLPKQVWLLAHGAFTLSEAALEVPLIGLGVLGLLIVRSEDIKAKS
ncbi:MAG: hypothetical protein RR075_00350 [Pygmaiobacter sp.]